jgi:lysophospholipid acyltransferase (LPLAT)-like uncharacterized protein
MFTGAVGVAGAWVVRRWLGTLRFHFRYADPSVSPAEARKSGQRYLYAFFHEVMLFPAYVWNWPEMQIMISDSYDGDICTQIVRKLGFQVVRGSTTRGGARALKEMTHRVDRGHLCLTPDGPRGPRRHVHQGLAYLASRTGLPVVGAGMAFRNPWRLKSWDRFALPKPFSAAACVAPEALIIPHDAGRATLEDYRREVERRMQQATIEAEDWVRSL